MFALVGHRGLGYFERVDRVRKHPEIKVALIAGPQNIADVSLVQVPYRGGGPALTDLIAGQVQVVFLPPAIARLKPTS